jgi:hypothetical protein
VVFFFRQIVCAMRERMSHAPGFEFAGLQNTAACRCTSIPRKMTILRFLETTVQRGKALGRRTKGTFPICTARSWQGMVPCRCGHIYVKGFNVTNFFEYNSFLDCRPRLISGMARQAELTLR